MTRVGIVGGGIAGLATAHFVRQALPDADVRVFEASERPGGKILTERIAAPGGAGFLVEHGPTGFLDNEPATLELAKSVGLDAEILRSSDDARRRYVYLRGRLFLLPESPPAFVRSRMLSWSGKVRVAREWFVRPLTDESAAAETVAEFTRRRLGSEFLHAFIEPFVHGVFAGDPERLELSTAFPKMAALEREQGGCLRGLVAFEKRKRAAARAGNPKPLTVLTSFREGMGMLPGALARALGERIVVNTSAVALTRAGSSWRLLLTRTGGLDAWQGDAVVLATPSPAAAALVKGFAPEAARDMSEIPAAPIAVVALGFESQADFAKRLDGFGFLVARGEKLRALGILAETNTWRRESRGFLVRVMYGGTPDPAACSLDDSALVELARQDLRQATGIADPPAVARVIRWKAAIPQYERGHGARVAAIEAALAPHAGLYLAGASYHGVSVNDLCRNAKSLAARIAASIRRTPT